VTGRSHHAVHHVIGSVPVQLLHESPYPVLTIALSTETERCVMIAIRSTRGPADWRSHAACRHADPDLFFPEGTAGPTLLAVDRAKRLCETCPVQSRCLDWALDHHAAFGIWGGLTEGERRDLRHALARLPRQRGSQVLGQARP
jgi:WhiB family redox-sensing transcriptional regulator